MSAEDATLSKSARKRANQKARAAEEEAAPPAPAAVSKAAAPAGYPEGAQPKAKAKGKAEPKAEPAAKAKPEPKAKAKAEAKAQAEPKAEPKAEAKAKAKAEPAPKQQAKAKAKGAAAVAAAAQALKDEEEEKKKQDVTDFTAFDRFDDGSGGDWAVSTGKTKQQEKREEKAAEQKKVQAQQAAQGSTGGKHIPGVTVASGTIPGMAPSGKAASKKQDQGVSAGFKIDKPEEVVKEEPKGDSTSVSVKVPEERVGIVIGPKGKNIKLIQEKTGCTRIDTTGSEFTITGPADAVAQAEIAVMSLIEKGYTALAYDNFEENLVMVPDRKLPDIIGKKGAIIIKLKEALGVEVSIPKNTPPGRKAKVTVAGPTNEVKKALEVIESIIQFQHHELTHPGETHEELEIPSWAYAWIIGSKGSELRHIQNNFKVKVSIPREEEGNVVVVGLKEDVPRAVAYMWKILDGAKDQAKGRDRQEKSDGDAWGDEGPEEDWMKQYMYKR